MKEVTIEDMDKQLRRLTVESQYRYTQIEELGRVVSLLNSYRPNAESYLYGLFVGLQYGGKQLYIYDKNISKFVKTKYHPDNNEE